jgi:two-component system sensor histidine kinase UhpB
MHHADLAVDQLRWQWGIALNRRQHGARWRLRQRGDAMMGAMPHRRRVSLFWKVFAVNAVVLIAAGLALALTPATVSSPITLREAATLVAGICALLVVNLGLMHRTFAPHSRLTAAMASIDPLQPGLRLHEHDDLELGALAASFNVMADRLESERRASAAQLLTAQEDDRRQIAAELHDEVGQQLTALLLMLDRFAIEAPDALTRDADAARELARSSLAQLRALVRGLRPAGLDELGLTAALTALTRQVSQRTGIPIARKLDRIPADTDPATVLVIYRIAQECLTNVARHAPHATVTLTLTASPKQLVLHVRDDGPAGHAAKIAAGTGIRSMRERALARIVQEAA